MFHGKRASTPLPKAAERLVNAFADSIQPLIDVPIGVWKFVRKEVQAYQGLRDLVGEFYKRLGTHYGKPEAWTFEPSVAERELRALLAENADKTQARPAVPLSDRCRSRHRRVGQLDRRRRETARAGNHKCWCAASPGSRRHEYCFGNLGGRVADRAVRAPRP